MPFKPNIYKNYSEPKCNSMMRREGSGLSNQARLQGTNNRSAAERVLIGLIVGVALSSCAYEERAGDGADNKAGMKAVTQTDLGGLENVHRFSAGVYGGSVPATDEAFAALARLGATGEGIATIVSVDGAEPDLARADAHGMRYVHIPIGYDGIDPEALAQLAAVMRDLPRPIYVHCHHGRHRGPAAAAAGLIAMGEIQPGDGLTLMKTAGTSDAYAGLFRDVAQASVLGEAQITAGWLELVERRSVTGLIATMVEINHAFDRLDLTRAVRWQTPDDHPDLAPAAEAGIIRDLLANLANAPNAHDEPAAFREMLAQSISAADRLEAGLVSWRGQRTAMAEGADEHEQNYQKLKQTCTDCHLQYRDR